MGQIGRHNKPLGVFVYLCLVLSLSYLTYKGPILNYLKNETSYFESRIKVSSLNLPVALLCQLPGFKSNVTSQDIIKDFVARNDYEDRLAMTAVYDNLLSIKDVVGSMGILDVKGNYVSQTLDHWGYIPIDLLFVGQCFYLPLSLYKDSFLNRNSLVIGLGTTSSDIPLEDNTISLQFLEESELGLLGFVMEELGSDPIPIDLGTTTQYQLRMKRITRIRKCQPDQGKSLSQCLINHKDERYPMCQWRDLMNNTCRNATQYMNRLKQSFMRNSYESIRNETGCLLPCQRIHYSTRIALQTKLARSIAHEPHSTIHIQLNMDDRVAHLTEYQVFNLYDLASGFGGLAGLFLGLSIWGCFKYLRNAFQLLGLQWETPT
ncbi:uncharacterized protein LOC131879818 [Tigriopus californicus]|uniref:uncharacterized protein LOC131879818 n=1 Tax=Tigriopus californicus TaxID=6832 RepID=UPI0027DA530B|nr:uncharacterized protein LOC131879818 [Tigriopus californicus]